MEHKLQPTHLSNPSSSRFRKWRPRYLVGIVRFTSGYCNVTGFDNILRKVTPIPINKFLTPAKVRKESLDIGNSKLHKSKSKEVIKIKHPGEEGQRLEFKSSFFIHGNTVKRNNRIVRIVNHRQRVSEEKKGQEDIAATVCSFLNSDGGDVYIGVDDKTKICYGLEREFTRTNNSADTYTQTVRQTIQSKFREHYTTCL